MSRTSGDEAVAVNSTRLLAAKPENCTTTRASADALLSCGKLDEARAAYSQILDHESTNVHALMALGRIERQLGDDAAALLYLDRAASSDPDNTSVLTELAAGLRQMNRMEEAASVYQRILSRDGKHVAAHMGLGWIARARGNQAATVEHFTIATECLRPLAENDPDNLNTLLQLATALLELDRPEQAASVYRKILAINPTHPHSHIGMGWIAHRAGDPESALAYFRTACEANPGDLEPQMTLAKALALMRRFGESEEIYRRIAQQAPNNWQASAALGALAQHNRDWEGALEHFQAAAQANPNSVQVRIDTGRTLYDLSRWKDAERTYQQLLTESPGNIEALIGLGEVATARGDKQAALVWFEKAAEAAPLDLRPKQAIRQLKLKQGGYDWRTEIGDALVVARAENAPIQVQIEAAKTLVEYGLTEVARPVLSRLEARFPAARQLLLAVRQIERMGLAQPLVTSTDVADPDVDHLDSLRGFLEIPVADADTLLLVFAGTNNRVWMTFSLLHKILRKTGVSVVYCRDLQQEWYAQGVVGLGHDYESTVEGFAKLAARNGVKRILTLGNCVGCQGALRFGLSLGAQGVLGISPKLRIGDRLKPEQKAQLTGIRDRLQCEYKRIDIQYLEAAIHPKVTLIFGAECSDDAAAARSMAHVPGVTVAGIPDSTDTDSVKDLLVRGLLEPLLKDFVVNGHVSADFQTQISTSVNPQYSG